MDTTLFSDKFITEFHRFVVFVDSSVRVLLINSQFEESLITLLLTLNEWAAYAKFSAFSDTLKVARIQFNNIYGLHYTIQNCTVKGTFFHSFHRFAQLQSKDKIPQLSLGLLLETREGHCNLFLLFSDSKMVYRTENSADFHDKNNLMV